MALLIDADCTPWHALDNIVAEVAKHGTVTAKKAFGAFHMGRLNNYPEKMLELGIQAVFVEELISRKSSVDSALIIDAMDMLYSGQFDAFAIASSDADFTLLA